MGRSKSGAVGRTKSGKTKKKKKKGPQTQTIGAKFKHQLGDLNDTLLQTSPHYVRCIKPNSLKAKHNFDNRRILDQLLYSGVLETVRIRRQGFPFRETFTEFWRRCNAGSESAAMKRASAALARRRSRAASRQSRGGSISAGPGSPAQFGGGASSGAGGAAAGGSPRSSSSPGLDEFTGVLGESPPGVPEHNPNVPGSMPGGRVTGYKLLVKETHGIPAPPPPLYQEIKEKGGSRRTIDASQTEDVVALSKEGTEAICRALIPPDHWVMGRTKIFMKDGAMESISLRYRAHHTTRIQAWWRMSLARERYHDARRALAQAKAMWRNVLAARRAKAMEQTVIKLQAVVRGKLARKRAAKKRHARENAVGTIQRVVKGNFYRQKYLAKRKGAILMQSIVRMRQAMQLATKRRWLCIRVTSIVRGWRARRLASRRRRALREGCTRIQAAWRGLSARRTFAAKRKAALLL